MPTQIPSEIALTIFTVTAVVFLILSFLIVLRVKSIPNKLLLLGVLMTVVAVGFGAFLPGMTSVALTILILAVICVLIGVICLLISHIAGTVRSGSETGPKP
jgi:prepilin signal peptidase PulO-like enzyme (type II secretory pathway)